MLKGSLIRKRYILVYWESPTIDKYLYTYYGIKRKYRHDKFSIYLCSQLNRNAIEKIINDRGGKTIITSGTIKKCKKTMSKYVENPVLKSS